MTDDAIIYEATVVRLDARGCLVRLDDPPEDLASDARLWCNVRGRIHLRDRTHQKSPVAVGDRVRVVRTALDRGAIESIEPRRSLLSRPANRQERVEHVIAANLDAVALVSAAADPEFNPALVDRVLAVIEHCDLEAILVINKIDLTDEAPHEVELYRSLGYPVFVVSATEGDGIGALRDALVGRVTVICGHSGVGKSSVLNAINNAWDLTVGDVNEFTGKGTHTTTATTLFELPNGGAVIDTAGVREFGLFGIPKRDLPWLFRDIAELAPNCKFPDCSHTHEPRCAVQSALVEGDLAPSRFDSYLRILESLDQAN